MKYYNAKIILLIILGFVLFNFSCKKSTTNSTSDDPVVTTDAVTYITQSTALAGGHVSYKDGTIIFGKGVCWNKTGHPTSSDDNATFLGDTGTFSCFIQGLEGGNTYYLRAYAHSYIDYYGPEVKFITVGNSLPTVSTNAVSNIRTKTAMGGGTIVSNGGTTVTETGICWNTTGNPTIALSTKRRDTVGIATTFLDSITPLKLGATYHVRAYAINSVGTAYGSDVTFVTAPGIGDTYQGGIIAYFFNAGDSGYIAGQSHGIIAAAYDQGVDVQWNNGANLTTGSTATAIGAGNANTNKIVTKQGAGTYAAKICADLVLGSYGDWYLPSKDELDKLSLNQNLIGGFTPNTYYWTSSETDNANAWLQLFNSGISVMQMDYSKNMPWNVRAIRSF